MSDTRDRIVDSARALFWEQGFESTSLAQIAERSGARAGSIYYFFKSKGDILLAVLDHYEEQLGHWLIDPVFERYHDPVERIFGVIDTYRTFLVETGFTLGCPVGGLAIEISDAHVEARARLSHIFDALVRTLEACVRDAGERLAGPAPEALAALSMSVIEGGIVQARASRSIEPFDRSVAALRDYFARLGAHPSNPPRTLRD